MADNSSKTTTDHDEIKQWAEARDAKPAHVEGTARDGEDVGLIRLDFPGYTGDKLETIEWDQWFDKFDKEKLALLYQEETSDGDKSNFNKLVSRDD